MNRLKSAHVFSLLLAISLAVSARADLPEWIWHDNHGAKPADGEVRYFRKTFEVSGKVTKAQLSIASDNAALVFINGHKIGENTDWKTGSYFDVAKELKSGANVIAIRGTNTDGPAGIIAILEIAHGRSKEYVRTDKTWLSSANGPDGWDK